MLNPQKWVFITKFLLVLYWAAVILGDTGDFYQGPLPNCPHIDADNEKWRGRTSVLPRVD